MTITEKRLGASTPTDTNVATLYTVPASTTIITTTIRVCNTSTGSATFRLFFVPSGDSADTTTSIYYDYNVPGNSTIADDGKHILGSGGAIQVRSSVASVLTFTVSGVEIT